ncbi:Kunitz/Bovine pancreatic trypsin inhibitor domain protein [Ancylostoma duodenale]|uniref:Kunitz/Bovine pancreatic trypsin inhibitor domain protein n=1 Tax=Ancylostoma duodenale TaxID=51022 RepID=A0A0C2HCV0_9BILA|nr:Kunitz/Bovine pancreatic trypsin inhibitor domain protein [Ancylostoma duodenale]
MLPLLAALALASYVFGSSDPCTLQLESGPCRASIQRYGYDTTKGKCVQFTYGGCEGNKNNFLSVENCKKECVSKGLKLDNSGKVPVPDRVKRSLFPLQTTKRNPFQAVIDKASSLKDKIGQKIKKVKKRFGKGGKIEKVPLPPNAGKDFDFEGFAWKHYRKILKNGIQDFCMHAVDYGSGQIVNQRYYYDKKRGKCTSFNYRRKSKRERFPLFENNFEFMSDCIGTCVQKILEGRKRGEKIQHEEPDLKAILAKYGIYYERELSLL